MSATGISPFKIFKRTISSRTTDDLHTTSRVRNFDEASYGFSRLTRLFLNLSFQHRSVPLKKQIKNGLIRQTEVNELWNNLKPNFKSHAEMKENTEAEIERLIQKATSNRASLSYYFVNLMHKLSSTGKSLYSWLTRSQEVSKITNLVLMKKQYYIRYHLDQELPNHAPYGMPYEAPLCQFQGSVRRLFTQAGRSEGLQRAGTSVETDRRSSFGSPEETPLGPFVMIYPTRRGLPCCIASVNREACWSLLHPVEA
ncbi:unnamed protein product [Trichogramma brassicae]|uniref:Uncharacterized protein n=1 Tax=Trichogramma brassicae TaxID=86971 RepID=A0A6H5ISX4_9HYME|nr:unnamed protein product [Trichogramma brassicae]